jgi:hypothetical protein
MSLVPVSLVSAEAGEIERLLQVQLNAPQLVINEAFDLTSPNADAAFAQYAKTQQPTNVVTAFVLASQVSQTATDIAAKGLRIDPTTGLKVTLGSFEVDRSAEQLEVLVLSIALGSPQNYQPPTLAPLDEVEYLESAPTHSDIKPGYHSLNVGPNQYVVFNPAQVKVGYLVKFAGGANLAESTELDNICDVCGKAEATVFCLNCGAKLCAECDALTHGVNTVLQRHERLPLAEARALMEFCPLHPNTRVEYYCPICRTPVCINCKMTGSHSKGEAATHPLIPIKDAYAQALELTEQEDPIVTRRNTAIDEKLATAEQLLNEVLANEKSVEDEINKIAAEAIEQAKKLAGEKIGIIRSVQTELARKRGELEALSRSLTAHRKKSGPQAFLRAVDRQNAIVNGISDITDLPLDLTVHGDLTVYGNLTVGGLRDAELSQGSRGLAALVIADQDAIDESGFQETPTTPTRKRGASGLNITSLRLVAAKKERRAKGVELPFQPFQRSKIITDPEAQLILYRCFPFKAQPQPHLLFSSIRDGRDIAKLHKNIDDIGITAVIVQVGERVFGGFAASKWNSDGVPFGDEGCSFLFNINEDSVIPYKPISEDAPQLYATPDLISFGKQDLVLAGNFDECSSVIENSYSLGFPDGPENEQAKTYLAGQEQFSADAVEVWGFYTLDPE